MTYREFRVLVQEAYTTQGRISKGQTSVAFENVTEPETDTCEYDVYVSFEGEPASRFPFRFPADVSDGEIISTAAVEAYHFAPSAWKGDYRTWAERVTGVDL